MPQTPELSVIIPVFNEQDNIGPLHERLNPVLGELDRTAEVIYVEDGSTDESFVRLQELAREYTIVRIIRLSRNFGQTAALAAGIEHARGSVIVTMDSDLQNDPKDVPRLLEKLAEGYDIVSGWRKERKDPLIRRRLPSFIANRLISSVTGVRLHDYGCTLKAYSAAALRGVRLYGEMHRFIPAYAVQTGARTIEIPVTHHPRLTGRSKYGILRTFSVLLDLILVQFLSAYGTKPIHVFGGIGLISCFFGFVAGAIALYEKYAMDVFVHRNPLILLAVFLFLLGVQFILLGLLAELQMRTYYESQNKPVYTIAELVNFDHLDKG